MLLGGARVNGQAMDNKAKSRCLGGMVRLKAKQWIMRHNRGALRGRRGSRPSSGLCGSIEVPQGRGVVKGQALDYEAKSRCF